ncbi:MAG: YraN family protein [Bacteroidales bacterium]|nr:YraN family protein [Bacteroidales bacterium]
MADSHILGKRGEMMAANYLTGKGYSILARNWRSGKKEIDIIAAIDNIIVFVEVKTRDEGFLVHPDEAVSVKKQRNIIFAAQKWIDLHKHSGEARFDIITIIRSREKNIIEHTVNAYYPTL